MTMGVVGDVCRALEEKVQPYCDGILTQLLKDLSSNQLRRSVNSIMPMLQSDNHPLLIHLVLMTI